MPAPEKRRTAEELKDPELNYYLFYGIDPNETDAGKISNKIKLAKNDAGGQLAQRRMLELTDDINEIMGNDAVFDETTGTYIPNKGGRKAELENAKKFMMDKALSAFNTFIQGRKQIFTSDIDDLCKKTKGFVTKEEFLKAVSYIEKDGVKIIDNSDDKSLPFRRYREIESKFKSLQGLNCKNFYEFLGVAPGATRRETELGLQKIKDKAAKITIPSQKQPYNDLIGIASTTFQIGVKGKDREEPEAWANYDIYLKLKEKIWDKFLELKDNGWTHLTAEAYEEYMSIAMRELNIGAGEAMKLIAIGCKSHGLTVDSDVGGVEYKVCPKCGFPHPKGADKCRKCEERMTTLCWNCGATVRKDEGTPTCPKCGAKVSDRGRYINAKKEIENLLGKSEVSSNDLKNSLHSLKNVVPKYASLRECEAYKAVAEYSHKVDLKIKEIETLGTAYKQDYEKIIQLKAKNSFFGALSAANALKSKFPSFRLNDTLDIIKDVKAKCDKAESIAKDAKRYLEAGNISQALKSADGALNISEDCPDAIGIFKKMAPKPVSDFKVKADGGVAKLEWTDNSGQELVSYTVIKKIGAVPKSAEDGTVIAKGLYVKFFEDSKVVSAVPTFYAVFTERRGVHSSLATFATPIVLAADVQSIQQEMLTEGVKAHWVAPQNVKTVEVWKKEGTVPPTGPGDGVKVESNLSGFNDAKCSARSAYLIICKYDCGGKIIASKGVSKVFKPFEKIIKITDAKIGYAGNQRFIFTCGKEYNGEVKLYYSESKLPIECNKNLKNMDFNMLCKGLIPIRSLSSEKGKIVFELTAGKVYYIYPIVSTEQLFIVSDPIILNSSDGIKDLSFIKDGGEVSVSGNPDKKVVSFVVFNGEDKFVEDVNDASEGIKRFEFSVKDFETNGKKINIPLRQNSVNYISIFPKYDLNGTISYSPVQKLSPAIECHENVIVKYELKGRPSAVKSFKVKIRFEAEKPVSVPSFLVKAGRGNYIQGKTVAQSEGIVLKKSMFSGVYKGSVTVKSDPVPVGNSFGVTLSGEVDYIKLRHVGKAL